MVANSVNFIKKGKSFGIQLVKNTGRPIELKKGNVIAKIEEVTEEFTLEAGECEISPRKQQGTLQKR